MARADLKQMTRTPEAKLGHFIVEFATPGNGTFSNRRVVISRFSTSSIQVLASKPSKVPCAILKLQGCRPSSVYPQRNITTSPGRATWVRKGS